MMEKNATCWLNWGNGLNCNDFCCGVEMCSVIIIVMVEVGVIMKSERFVGPCKCIVIAREVLKVGR